MLSHYRYPIAANDKALWYQHAASVLQCNTNILKVMVFYIGIAIFHTRVNNFYFLKGTLLPIPIWLYFPMKHSTRASVVQTSWKTNFKYLNKWQTRLHQFSIAKRYLAEQQKSPALGPILAFCNHIYLNLIYPISPS